MRTDVGHCRTWWDWREGHLGSSAAQGSLVSLDQANTCHREQWTAAAGYWQVTISIQMKGKRKRTNYPWKQQAEIHREEVPVLSATAEVSTLQKASQFWAPPLSSLASNETFGRMFLPRRKSLMQFPPNPNFSLKPLSSSWHVIVPRFNEKATVCLVAHVQGKQLSRIPPQRYMDLGVTWQVY